MREPVTGYMCMIDFEDQLGIASGGTEVYPSIDDLKKTHPSWLECGIVEVTVTYKRTVSEQNLDME